MPIRYHTHMVIGTSSRAKSADSKSIVGCRGGRKWKWGATFWAPPPPPSFVPLALSLCPDALCRPDCESNPQKTRKNSPSSSQFVRSACFLPPRRRRRRGRRRRTFTPVSCRSRRGSRGIFCPTACVVIGSVPLQSPLSFSRRRWCASLISDSAAAAAQGCCCRPIRPCRIRPRSMLLRGGRCRPCRRCPPRKFKFENRSVVNLYLSVSATSCAENQCLRCVLTEDAAKKKMSLALLLWPLFAAVFLPSRCIAT